MKLTESKTFTATFPKTQPSLVLAGKKFKVDVKINKIHNVLPMSQDDLLGKLKDQIPGVDTLDAMKAHLTKEFGEQITKDYIEIIHRRKTLDALDNAYDFGMSAKLIEDSRADIQKSFEAEQKKAHEQGIILQEEVQRSAKENESEFLRLAKRRIKAHEIFTKIKDGHPNELKIGESDMRMALVEYAQNYNIPFEQALEFLKKNENFAKRIMSRVFETKTLDFVHNTSTLNQKTIIDVLEVFRLYDEIMPSILMGV